MNMAMFHSFWTVGALIIFVGIIFWAFSKRRRDDFEEASRLPLEDDQPISKNDINAEQS
jgi:cytochrome c oxidase cbb3-type subunit 4